MLELRKIVWWFGINVIILRKITQQVKGATVATRHDDSSHPNNEKYVQQSIYTRKNN